MKDRSLKRKSFSLSARSRPVKTVPLAADAPTVIKKTAAPRKNTNKKPVKAAAVVAKPAKSTAAAKTGQARLRFALSLGVMFILAGSLLGYPTIMRLWNEKHQTASAPSPAPERTPEVKAATQEVEAIEGHPNRLVVPSLGIDVAVADGYYNAQAQTWTLTNDKAHFATEMTPKPNNQAGNTFIYGHNRKEVFAKLSKLAEGETVDVYTDNGRIFTYKFRSAYETNPNDSSLFNYQGPPILTLQTCSGLWYQNRYLMTFDLVKVA